MLDIPGATLEEQLATLKRCVLGCERMINEIDAKNPGMNNGDSHSIFALYGALKMQIGADLALANGLHQSISDVHNMVFQK